MYIYMHIHAYIMRMYIRMHVCVFLCVCACICVCVCVCVCVCTFYAKVVWNINLTLVFTCFILRSFHSGWRRRSFRSGHWNHPSLCNSRSL